MNYTELFKQAKWVSPSTTCDAPYIRGMFDVKETKGLERACITICGLGFFEAYINEKKVSDDIFVPLYTDYHQYDKQQCKVLFGEELGHRIICPRYDISKHIEEGKNVIGILLGPGYYKYSHNPHYGEVKVCYRITLTYTNGKQEEIYSDTNLKWAQSSVIKSDFTIGEEHDYSYEQNAWLDRDFDDSQWLYTIETDIPDTDYYIQSSPADKLIRSITPKVVYENDSVTVYDVGENITGYPVVFHNSSKREKVVVRVSEELKEDGQIDDYYTHNQISTFHTDGKERYMNVRFTWNAFRYVEVTNNAIMTECVVIHADVIQSSSFSCDNKVLNWLYDACVRTQLNNMHCGIPSDCPHIERRGYTGDGQLMCETVMMLLDAKEFYRKWIDDISDCQDRISGHVQYTAPYVISGGGPGGWGCAIVEVPYVYYLNYGDKELLERMYPQMLHYFDYLEAHSENNLVVSDQKGLWCLGDWCTAEKINIPESFINNFFYIKSMYRVIEIEKILGINEKTQELEKRIQERCKAIIDTYYNPDTGNFCDNIQGSNAFAVYLKLGDDRTLSNLVTFYSEYCMYNTGIFGTDVLTYVLFENGHSDLAFKLMSSEGKYSFGNWMNKGSTTLWEYWTEDRSHNHPMFGAVTKYLFMYILGIRQTSSNSYSGFIINPAHIEGLNYAEGHITTMNGRIYVKYVKANGNISFTVDVDVDNILFKYNSFERRLSKGCNSFSVSEV